MVSEYTGNNRPDTADTGQNNVIDSCIQVRYIILLIVCKAESNLNGKYHI